MARYALVIGISQYDSPSFRKLNKPAASATKIAQLLKEYGDFEVEFFPRDWHNNPNEVSPVLPFSMNDWEQVLDQFRKRIKNNTGLFYFSGHGFLTESWTKREEAYLALSGSEHVSFEDLGWLFLQSHCSQLIVWLDCCYAGAMMDATFLQQALAQSTNDNCDYALITACSSFEEAYEGDQKSPYTLFTGQLVQTLENALNSQGRVSSGILYDSVFSATKGSGQEPRGMNLGKPIDIVLDPVRSSQMQGAVIVAAGQTLGVNVGVNVFSYENPYRGLEAFQEEDADLFFGRDTAVGNLVRRVLTNQFLAVIGASGSGKSSLVNAGLIPKLKRGDGVPGSETWEFITVRPAKQPANELIQQLESIEMTTDQLVVIDQFEEVFTIWQESDRSSLMLQMRHWIEESQSKIRVIINMRGEFLDLCSKSEITDLINQSRNVYLVQPLSAQELGEAIVNPAERRGVTVQEGLVIEMGQQVLKQPGALPLLQYTLQQLWEDCIDPVDPERRQLTLDAYERLGGVSGSLDERAEALFKDLSEEHQQLLQKIFIEQLVESGEALQTTNEEPLFSRRRTSWEDLGKLGEIDQVRATLDPFINARLLVTGEQVEVAHEALLTKWKRLQGWLMASRDPIRLRKRLELEYNDWMRYGQSEQALLHGALLAEILEKLDSKRLPTSRQEFVRWSQANRDRLEQAQIEQARQLQVAAEARAEAETAKAKESEQRVKVERRGKQLAISSTVIVSLLAIIVGVFWRNAKYQEVNALLKSAQAQFVSNRNSLDTLVAAVKADERRRQSNFFWAGSNPKLESDALRVLQQARYWVRERNRLEGHQSYVQSVSFSPNGDLVATASFDKTVKLWDPRTGELKRTLEGHTEPVTYVSFHPTEDIIFTGSKDKTVRLWKRDGTLLTPPLSTGSDVWALSFDSTSQTLAIACEDGTVQFWDLRGKPKQWGKYPKSWKPDAESPIYSISFSPDGQTIATASQSGTAKIWDLNGKERHSLKGHASGKAIFKIRFSPDGSTIATASQDRTAILWDAKTGNKKMTLSGHTANVTDVSFNPASKSSISTLATASLDGTVKIWNSQWNLIETLAGHSSRVNSVSFSPNGELLASGSNDTVTRLWQVNNLDLTILAGHQGKAYNAAISPDSQTIVSAGDDGVKLWLRGKIVKSLGNDYAIATYSGSEPSIFAISGQGEEVKLFDWQGNSQGKPIEAKSAILSLSFSPQKDLALSGLDRKVQIWNSQTQRLQLLDDQKVPVYSVHFSPDGQHIATGNANSVVKIWGFNKKLIISEFNANQREINSVRFTPNSQGLATAGQDGTIKFWGLDGKLVNTIKGKQAITDTNFSPNGTLIAASDDNIANLWGQDGKLIATFTGHDGPVNSAVFSPDGKTLVTASSDGRIFLWHNVHRLDLESQREGGCKWLQDYLALRKDEPNPCN